MGLPKLNNSDMSYCREDGKDKVIFMTREDLAVPSTITFEEEGDPPGLMLPNGDINWSCPCLGGMAVGPCGVEFREAFSCFHYSEVEPKGSDCLEKFGEMQNCMQGYPELFGEKTTEEKEEEIVKDGAAAVE